ncbi:MAG: hypothetical protein KAH95_17360 [Spirochaetales bacterium]|nr:hypothetical protein [Spirochaetales bacterium]
MTEGSLLKLKKDVLDRVYFVFLIIGGIALAFASIDPVSKGNWILFILYVSLYLLVLLIYLIKKVSSVLRVLIVLLSLFSIGISELWFFGFASMGYLYLFASIILACWLVSASMGVVLFAVSFISTGIIAAFYSYGNLDMSSHQRQIADDLIDWISPFLGFFVMSIAFISLFKILNRELQKNILANLKHQEELETSHSNLESNIAKQKEYHNQLEISLKEKGLLLQEVQHRVRNNLQIISSLINISSSFSENIEDFKQKIALRIHAMTLMHERLSEEEGFASVDLESYIHDLIGVVYELYEIDINKIKISFNIPEKIVIKIDLASSLGILINEIISNAILHAFKSLHGGLITVNIHKLKDHLKLEIKDDGIGLPNNYKDINSFGFLMIESLVKQLDGKLITNTGLNEDDPGTEFVLTIPFE